MAALNRPMRLVATGLVVLAAGWLVAPRPALPLYDGLGFPDQPYRFVQPPPGAPQTKPPSTALVSAPASAGSVSDLNAVSAEIGPQVSVQIPAGALTVPAAAPRVTLQAAPAPPLPAPHGQYLWSNVYDVTVAPAATLHAGQMQASITLRAATGQRPLPHIAVYSAGHWTPLATLPVGRDIYDAELTQFGRYAVLGSVPLDLALIRSPAPGSRSWGPGAVLGASVAAALLAVVLLGRRRRSRSRRHDEEDP